MVNNPDDMGIYNPDIDKWVEIVHDAGGLCFYDHANFNGVMGKIRARELGFDACMFMLHKTFGAPKGGGGPAVGAYGCTAELARSCPARRRARRRPLPARPRPARDGVGRVREFLGNVPQVVKAYAWSRAMGADGITRGGRHLRARQQLHGDAAARDPRRHEVASASDRAAPRDDALQPRRVLERETGITVFDVQNRMVDFGIDAFWLSHEPWLVPQPFTPGGGRDVVEGGHRRLDRRPRPRRRRGLHRPGDRSHRPAQPGDPPAGRRRISTTRRSGRRPGARISQARRRCRSGRRRVLAVDSRLLAGRVALVTGGTRGLGAAIARTFAGEGARGAVVDLESGPAPEDWISLTADVTAEEDVERAVAARSSGSAAWTSSSRTPASSHLGATLPTSTSPRSIARSR